MTIAALFFALLVTSNAEAAGEPVLLDFHASWCGPCQQMRPVVEELARKGYRVKSVDIDRAPELAERYGVSAVPTFIVTDGAGQALGRTEGLQPAANLANLYQQARAKLAPPVKEAPAEPAPAASEAVDDDAPVNPKPWETGVRIKVHGNGAIGFGSGTIVHSTPQESIILTCAHIFKLDGPQAPPAKFPRRITIDLFDGKLVGRKPAMVHYANETYEGEAIDYDFARDVGLIRIRPGRRLPASRVVPPHWKPQPRMLMTTVGCSEGHDATAWSTVIVDPSMRALSGNPTYEAIECQNAPKQGRSGGGLYTSDGYVAGVCDFAEPRGNHGLYAAPNSIYHILSRNKLTALYQPVSKQAPALLASNSNATGAKPRRATGPRIMMQSPDRDESSLVTIPPPELLNIKPPQGAAEPARVAVNAKRDPWRPAPRTIARTDDDGESTRRTDLELPPEADSDHFTPAPAEKPTEPPVTRVSRPWRPVRTEPSAN